MRRRQAFAQQAAAESAQIATHEAEGKPKIPKVCPNCGRTGKGMYFHIKYCKK